MGLARSQWEGKNARRGTRNAVSRPVNLPVFAICVHPTGIGRKHDKGRLLFCSKSACSNASLQINELLWPYISGYYNLGHLCLRWSNSPWSVFMRWIMITSALIEKCDWTCMIRSSSCLSWDWFRVAEASNCTRFETRKIFQEENAGLVTRTVQWLMIMDASCSKEETRNSLSSILFA